MIVVVFRKTVFFIILVFKTPNPVPLETSYSPLISIWWDSSTNVQKLRELKVGMR